MFERQACRKAYLLSYQKLLNSTLQGQDLLTQIKEFLNKPQTPLSTIEKENWLTKIKEADAVLQKSTTTSSQDPENFKEQICKLCQPTYFNLMKAMYPLLADTYLLFQQVHGKKAGVNIGNFKEPIENAIRSKAKYSKDLQMVKLAENLAHQLRTYPNRSFFGYWD